MKRAFITGTRQGLGQLLLQILSEEGYVCCGLNRSEDFDISDPHIRQKIIQDSLVADVFINCAHAKWSQIDLLLELSRYWDLHKKRGATVISIGSRAASDYKLRLSPIDYDHQKIALRSLNDSLAYNSNRYMLLEFGFLKNGPPNTPHLEDTDIRKIFKFVLNLDSSVQIRSLLAEKK